MHATKENTNLQESGPDIPKMPGGSWVAVSIYWGSVLKGVIGLV